VKGPGYSPVEEAKRAALQVLLANSRGPYGRLPRAAGWGYPEPYTRDLMISSLGILASGNEELIATLRRVLKRLAGNRSEHGQIPSLVHNPEDRGASDTTPLFLMAVALYRKAAGEPEFLARAVEEADRWVAYQSPEDRVLVAHQPTTDWRDEQWVLGYGLFVNSVVYTYLRLHGMRRRAAALKSRMNRFVIRADSGGRHEGLALPHEPYYALWSYKLYDSDRFDLLGNSLAVLSGIASPSRAKAMISWVEDGCDLLRRRGELAADLPPNLFPYIRPEDPDWRPRYARLNRPGEYHNGGIWPFICAFYVAAVVAAGRMKLAEEKLAALTNLVRPARKAQVEFGFNEWLKAQDGTPMGEDWQTWSAAMYLYAAAAVEKKKTPFFDGIRNAG